MPLLSPKINTKEMVPLCRQLATAYDAGIPVVRSLEMAGDNARGATRIVLRNMSESVKAGMTLEDAARQEKKRLPDFFIELLASGEHGGRLDVMLRDLADFYEDRQALNRTVRGAMVMPTIQIVFAWFLGTFAIGIISNLSLDARSTFNIMDYIQQYLRFQAMVVAGVGVVAVICIILARFGLFGWVWGAFTTRVYPFSMVTQKFALSRFFRSLSLLITSGMNIKQCIQRAAATANNPYIERDLLQAVPMVAQGATLVQAFAGSRFLTPVAREMLAVGEESGELDTQLRKVSEYHYEEARHAVQVAVKLMNVALTLGVGIVIGAIVISFYSKYFSLLDSI